MLSKTFSFLVIFLFSTVAFSQKITGVIIDANSNEALPFTAVSLINQLSGTISNAEGQFELTNNDSTLTDTLQVNFIGYELFKVPVYEIKGNLTIQLKPTSVVFDEVLIEPREPTWYIKEAIKQRGSNYPSQPFQTIAYYNEVMKENDHYTKFTEAVIKSNHSVYVDTSKSIHQLLLFKASDKIEDMQFMKAKMEKMDRKKRKQAEKKGEEYDEKSEAVTASFGGPNSILLLDNIKSGENFLDSTKFKKYEYNFDGASTYKNIDIIIIGFKSKRTLDNLKQHGKIYINTESNVIVGIDFNGQIVIPALAKPFMLAYGLSVHSPRLAAKVRFKQIDTTWYPEIFQIKLDGAMTKRYTFKENEYATFEIEQVLSMNKILPNYTAIIPKEKQFDASEEMPKQVYNDEGFEWKDINVMKVSY
ncbi:MAG: carboxypeptidase-like regulatory domain-containing protein [Bacteroidia bacterium]|nr:carboxypeptidase-like regulatory domain-containing protein [Bacteroidia bacterium]